MVRCVPTQPHHKTLLTKKDNVGLIAACSSACSLERFQPLITIHQQKAVKALNEALSDDKCLDESAFFAVKALLTVAVSLVYYRSAYEVIVVINAHRQMYQQNMQAVRLHFLGVVAMVQKVGNPYRLGPLARKCMASFACWTSHAPSHSILVPFTTLVWPSTLNHSNHENQVDISEEPFPTSSFPDSTIVRHLSTGYYGWKTSPGYGKPHPSSSSPSDLPNVPTQHHLQPPTYHNTTTNFSPTLRTATQRITALSTLARRSRTSTLSHQELAELIAGICSGGQRLASMKPASLSPIEDCMRMATLIHFFADVVPFDDGDESPIIHLTDKIRGKLHHVEIDILLLECPELCLWLALVSGAFASDETCSFFQTLCRRACGRLGIRSWDGGVIACIDSFQPISSDPFLRACKAFWLSSRVLIAATAASDSGWTWEDGG